MKTELGGDRLGSGNKQEISLKNYERSSHDLGYVWRSSMASGTLVPFMSEVGLPGDSFDIDLECDVKTLPTIGPLFGSYKVQLDVFQCPVRLYQGKLHMNMLNIGMDMSEVLLPQYELKGKNYKKEDGDNQQISPSALYSYLNVRGIGYNKNVGADTVNRMYNAIPLLGYWDVYKNYYANKQEEEGVVIHALSMTNKFSIKTAKIKVLARQSGGGETEYDINGNAQDVAITSTVFQIVNLDLVLEWDNGNNDNFYGEPKVDTIEILMNGNTYIITNLWEDVTIENQNNGFYKVMGRNYNGPEDANNDIEVEMEQQTITNTLPPGAGIPNLVRFDLNKIDDMRMDILEAVRDTTAFTIDDTTYAPYGLGLGNDAGGYYATSNQEGLGIKTYQSDLFNNWISTEWIDGTNGINEVTAVSTANNEFTIDALNLANKVYNMLNRIAISGGSYDDWLDAVYTHERSKSCENPIYHGSLIKELAFEEVVSNADTEVEGNVQPLGTLAGRGRLTEKKKGGKIKIKVDEPSYILGIVSITPRIDYSQGNKWDVNLKTMNDLHKPALDEIGFQDLVTDQMAWFDTEVDSNGDPTYKSAGKQPAWINYMTNVNQCRGDFAVGDEGQVGSMFMTLNRKYEAGDTGIEDLTTYVDPSKYNSIFAQESLSSQNFWVQIRNDIFARRKMSAKVIPNL